jgi:hypothetical protein
VIDDVGPTGEGVEEVADIVDAADEGAEEVTGAVDRPVRRKRRSRRGARVRSKRRKRTSPSRSSCGPEAPNWVDPWANFPPPDAPPRSELPHRRDDVEARRRGRAEEVAGGRGEEPSRRGPICLPVLHYLVGLSLTAIH